jgi:hypothetical protein
MSGGRHVLPSSPSSDRSWYQASFWPCRTSSKWSKRQVRPPDARVILTAI